MLTHAISPNPLYQFAADVRAGLTHPGQKELPSKYLYDDVGTALFEVISVLPEYGLTRADERLLRRHANDIVDRIDDPVIVAELGSGSGKKTRWLLEALCSRQQTYYCPIEISATALAMCRRELSDLESISIVGFEREYLDGLLEVAARRQDHAHLLVLFLGSTIGHFDLQQFKHVARFNPEARSVEMHLRSSRKQTVAIPAADLSVCFKEGETIWTESSHKYSRHELLQIAMAAGFRCRAQWIDDEWGFAENLFIAN